MAAGSQSDIVAIDFTSDNRLFGLENNADVLVSITTGQLSSDNASRLSVIQMLPEGDYTALTYDPTDDTSTTVTDGILVRKPSGDPVG